MTPWVGVNTGKADTLANEWNIGDRVFVPRITKDPTHILRIHDWPDDDDPDPDVMLIYTILNGKGEITHQNFRVCKFHEMQDAPKIVVRGGHTARKLRNLPDVHCGCGCGSLTSGNEFKQGHDMKLKSRLLKAARAGDEEALTELQRRNWWKGK